MHKCEGSKRCIFLQFVCDGENDCLNGSDESEDNCLSEYFVFTSYCDLGQLLGIVAVSTSCSQLYCDFGQLVMIVAGSTL